MWRRKRRSSSIYVTTRDLIALSGQTPSSKRISSEDLHGNLQGRGLIVDEMPLKCMAKNCELVFVQVTLAGGAPPLFAGAHYRSQIPSNESLDGREAALQQVSSPVGNEKASVIFMGDFNLKGTHWETHSNPLGNPTVRIFWEYQPIMDQLNCNACLLKGYPEARSSLGTRGPLEYLCYTSFVKPQLTIFGGLAAEPMFVLIS